MEIIKQAYQKKLEKDVILIKIMLLNGIYQKMEDLKLILGKKEILKI